MSYAAEIFIQFGLDTDVAYPNGEFRGKDDWLRALIEGWDMTTIRPPNAISGMAISRSYAVHGIKRNQRYEKLQPLI